MASMSGRSTKKTQQMPILKGFDETNDLLVRVLRSQKPGNDLIQNCDLPPPVKVFGNSDNAGVIISNRIRKNISSLTSDFHQEEEIRDGGSTQFRLLKALRLSQTRAREAEAKYASIGKEMESLSVAFVQDSMQVFGYRQVLRLVEYQVQQLQVQQKANRECCECEGRRRDEEADDDGNGNNNGVNWMMTIALCFGFAGFGFAIGCKYYW